MILAISNSDGELLRTIKATVWKSMALTNMCFFDCGGGVGEGHYPTAGVMEVYYV